MDNEADLDAIDVIARKWKAQDGTLEGAWAITRMLALDERYVVALEDIFDSFYGDAWRDASADFLEAVVEELEARGLSPESREDSF